MSRRALLERVHAPVWEPRQRPWVVEPLGLLVGGVIACGVFLLFRYELRGIVFASVAFSFSFLVAVIVYRTSRAVAAFDQKFLRLIQREDDKGLEELVRRSWYVRHFGPRGLIASRLGMIAILKGDVVDAERYLERAWVRTAPDARQSLVAPLCRIKYQVGSFADMRELAEDWLRARGADSPAAWYLAFGRLESEGLTNEELEDLVARAGASEDPIDDDVRNGVFERMRERVDEDEQPLETAPIGMAEPVLDTDAVALPAERAFERSSSDEV